MPDPQLEWQDQTALASYSSGTVYLAGSRVTDPRIRLAVLLMLFYQEPEWWQREDKWDDGGWEWGVN